MTEIVNEPAPERLGTGSFSSTYFDPEYFDAGGTFERETTPPTVAVTEE